MSQKFMTSSVFLFLDLIVVAASGWLYWLVISKIVSISEVGQSTAVYSLVILTATIVGLGMEYPLLKNTSSQGPKFVGSSLIVEVMATIAAVPFMLLFLNNLHYGAMDSISVVAILTLPFLSLGLIARFVLLGISASRNILLIDTVSTVVKFVTGYILVLSGFGVLGILISFMLQALIILCVSLVLIKKRIGFRIGDLKYFRAIVIDGVVNIPSILSRTLIFNLSVVLLASFGIADSEIGIYYIALMISLVAAGLISSTAYMVIPASSMAQADLSIASIRIGVSFTAPIISLLLASPAFILSLIGEGYDSGQLLLMVLAVGILPFAVVTNTISRFNYLGKLRKLLFIGLVQAVSFVVGFILLVPQFGSLGAAISILISYSISCLPSLLWSEKASVRYLVNVIIAVVAGWVISVILRLFMTQGVTSEVTLMITSMAVTLVLIFAFKNTTIGEVRGLLKTVVGSSS
jgi:O-antigen/teichoic acid export membrane protein